MTGDGWLRRALYTDGAVSVLAFRRSVLLTSIECGALRGDLGSRALLIDLEPIPPERMRPGTALSRDFEASQPRILGALLDLLAEVLRLLPEVDLPALTRMADYARVLAAVDRVLGTDGLRAYEAQRGRVAGTVLESDPVGAAIVARWGDGGAGGVDGEWSGSASDLYAMLTPRDPTRPPHGWPRDAAALGRQIVRLAAPLLAVGIVVERERTPGGRRSRRITIRRVGESDGTDGTAGTRGATSSHEGEGAGDDARNEPALEPPREGGQATVPSVPPVPERPWRVPEGHSAGTARDGTGREREEFRPAESASGGAGSVDRDGRDGRDGSARALSGEPCGCCGGLDWWRPRGSDPGDLWTCGRCHPPLRTLAVERWGEPAAAVGRDD